MKKLTLIAFVFAFVVLANVPLAPRANAETAVTTSATVSLAETIKSLLAKIADLQSQIAKINGEVRVALKEGLKEGATDEDIKKIQELLASDTAIYPEGKVTGYFGGLTKEALKRFQQKHSIAVTGEIDGATKELLDEYLKERFGGKVPQGLLHAPGIMKKVKENLCSNSGKINARGLFCKDHKGKGQGKDDDEDEDEDEDSDDGFDVEVEVEDGKTTVEFTVASKTHTVSVTSTTETKVLEAVAAKLGKTVATLDADLVSEIKSELKEAIADEADDASDDDKSDAQEALDDAEDAIDEVKKDIAAAASGVDTDVAEALIEDAEDLLDDAQDAFDAKDYAKAEDKADDAEDKADDAADELEDAIEDAE